ncbi:MAG: hypothetical protein ABI382_10710 [Nakamurella sp.]
MTQIDVHVGLTVLFCRGESVSDTGRGTTYDDVPADLLSGGFGPILAACRSLPIHVVGPRPKKSIDALLSGRLLVIGDDSDLNAVVLRVLRKDLLSSIEIAYAAATPTAVTGLYGLVTGPDSVRVAQHVDSAETPLLRSDSGGVLVGSAEITPVNRTFYVDSQRVPGGRPRTILVQPESTQGLMVTVTEQSRGWFDRVSHRKPTAYTGRAAEFGMTIGDGTTITFDGIRHPREVNRWVFYRHTEQLRLVRPFL